MLIEGVRTEPDPYEPFLLSQAIRVGDLLFVSEQAGYDDDGEIVRGGFGAQAAQAFSNLERALRAGGASLAEVVKVTIFVTDMEANFPAVVECRRRHFEPPYPADSIVEVAGLYTPAAGIEIEAIAVIGGERAHFSRSLAFHRSPDSTLDPQTSSAEAPSGPAASCQEIRQNGVGSALLKKNFREEFVIAGAMRGAQIARRFRLSRRPGEITQTSARVERPALRRNPREYSATQRMAGSSTASRWLTG